MRCQSAKLGLSTWTKPRGLVQVPKYEKHFLCVRWSSAITFLGWLTRVLRGLTPLTSPMLMTITHS